jgi:putative ABC transport system permease protein
METLWQDLKYAARMLVKRPGFCAVAVLTLALGIGANTAMFSVVNAVLLRPLPYPEADRVVFLSETSEDVPDMSISMANFNDWRAQNTVFESMVAYQTDDAVMTGRGEPERLRLRRMTAGFGPTLRVQPILGRLLTADDDKVGAAPVVLLSEGFWQRRFGRDPNILGQQLVLDGEPFTVIGVLPTRGLHPSFREKDLYTSLWRLEDKLGGSTQRDNHPGIYADARLKPGRTIEQARVEMQAIAARLARQYPDTNGKHGVVVKPLLDAVVEDVRPTLILLLAAVGFVLLIACANMANLLLARATERYRELAVRVALGASRRRLARQLLTESVLLAVLGGVCGLFVAVGITALITRSAFASVPRLDEVSVDRAVLAFTFILSLITGLVFGMAPAWQASRAEVHDALKESGRTGGGGAGRRRLRDGLVASEVAVSLVLLVGAGLMGKSLYRVFQSDGGLNPSHVLSANFVLPDARYGDKEKRRAFMTQLEEKVRAIPGAQAAGIKWPLLGGWQNSFAIGGRPLPKPGEMPSADMGVATAGAMEAMGMRLVRGRYFDERDTEQAQGVCIIDETLAKSYFPNEDAIGKQMATEAPEKPGQEPPWRNIVGVVAHVKNYGVDQLSRFEVYVPYAQRPGGVGFVVVRTAGEQPSLAADLRTAMHAVDADIPLFDVRSLDDVVAENYLSRQLSVALIGSFAALALLLAAVGVYGVMAYSVTQRNHEIGVRMALGAKPGDVLGMILRQGLRLSLIGMVAGLAAAAGLARGMASLLFQVSALDTATFLAGAAILCGVVLLACWVPARRATRVDPLVALRYE